LNSNLIKRSVLTALLAGTMVVGATAPAANAAVDVGLRVSVPGAEIAFRTTPRWVEVPGTRVYRVRDDMRPRQDFFRYDNHYYVYSHGSWYRANRWNGRYVVVRERDLPRNFRQVPRNHWRAYPGNWRNDRNHWRADRRDDRRDDRQDRREDRRDDRRDDREDRRDDRREDRRHDRW
jgi:hypothetical protein